MSLMDIEQKIERIKEYIKDKEVIIAFSGGADSTLVAKIANDMYKSAIVITIDNGALPPDCIKITTEIGIPHEIVRYNILKDQTFKSNLPNRCFICKNKMYNELQIIAKYKKIDTIIDGTNISDLLADRPGIMANYEKNIVSPLVYAGFNEEDVRNILKKLAIHYSISTTCFATIIPRYSEITLKKINRISYAESLIKKTIKDSPVREELKMILPELKLDIWSNS